MRRWTFRILISLVVAGIFAVAGGEAYRLHRQGKTREWSRINLELGTESLERIALGGVEQWILTRGQRNANPVLLWLQGGPGLPVFSWARRISVLAGLEHDYTIVFWEQRGTGKSAAVAGNPDAIHLSKYVADVCELGGMLRQRFQKPVYLVGHSFGTILGLQAIQKCPETFQAYAGIAQFVNVFEHERQATLFIQQAAERAGNREAMEAIQRIGKPPYGVDKIVDQRRWLGEFRGLDARFPPSNWRTFKDTAQAPEYTFVDLMRIVLDPYRARRLLQPELYEVNFLAAPLQVKLPVWLIHGRKDALCQPALVEQLYQHIDAPAGKEMVWFDEVAHMLPLEDPDGLRKVMQRVRDGAMKPMETVAPKPKPEPARGRKKYRRR
ncbi:MAG: alpha/beta hydrolase [Bryobacterales bacterium]|nr:alpha/beta hydrolase [Bryobacterales bacterium]